MATDFVTLEGELEESIEQFLSDAYGILPPEVDPIEEARKKMDGVPVDGVTDSYHGRDYSRISVHNWSPRSSYTCDKDYQMQVVEPGKYAVHGSIYAGQMSMDVFAGKSRRSVIMAINAQVSIMMELLKDRISDREVMSLNDARETLDQIATFTLD